MRSHRKFSVVIAAGESTSGAINISQFDMAHFHVEATVAGDYVSFMVAEKINGEFTVSKTESTGPLLNGHEITVEITGATSKPCWHRFPAHLFGMPYVKIVSTRAQVGAHTILISGSGPD